MLITTCTHCKAKFRVSPQQLNAKQGQVRCGRCRAVFNGFQSLERFPDDDTGARLLAAREAEERAARGPLSDIETLPDDELP
ncbi:MAG: MJ0042-type zinc finger domain-containing protein, partial [Usitatibacter sp.]